MDKIISGSLIFENTLTRFEFIVDGPPVSEILIHPNPEDLPDFLRNYRPDMIARRKDEAVVIEVKSRSSLNSSSTQYLPNLAQVIEQHPGWRFELVITECLTFSKIIT